MEYHHDVADTKDPLPANSSILYMNSKFVDKYSTDENESFQLINEAPENVVSITKPKACYDFSQTESRYSTSSIAHHNIADRNNYSSSFANTSMPDVNSQSVDNPSDSEESFEFINDSSDDAAYVVETKTCYSPQNVSSISLNDPDESNYSLTASASSSNVSFPSEDNSTYDESFEMINETSEDLVYVMKPKKPYDPQNISPNSTSNLESHFNISEDQKFARSSNVSILDLNFPSVDSDESFELINKTPEKVLYAKETQEFYSPQNVSSNSISNLESVHNTAFKKLCSSYVELCTNDGKPQQESKILALIAERKKVLASKNTPEDSERIRADGFIMEGLTKGIKNCDIAEKEFIASNKSHNNEFKANISMYEERSDRESENLFHFAEKRHVSTLANVYKYDEEICSDTMEKVIKGFESCSIVDKQFSSNIACEEKCSDEIKINQIVNKHDLVLQKNNLTSMNELVKKYELNYSKTCMIAKSRKRCVNQLFCLPYDDIFSEKEVVRAEQFLSCRPLNVVRPEIPEAISVLRSDCLCYLKKTVNSSTDGDESLELLIKTPENAVSVTETTPCYETQTSTHLSSDMGSVHSTTEDNKDSLSADISTYVNSPSVDSSKFDDKLSEMINDKLQNLIGNVSYQPETCSEIVSSNLTTDMESVNDSAREKNTSPAVVSMPDEKQNDDTKISLEDSTYIDSLLLSKGRKRSSSAKVFTSSSTLPVNSSTDGDESLELLIKTPENAVCQKNISAGDKGICRDIEEEVIKGIENRCTEKQLNEDITSDKMPDDSWKTVSGVKKEDKLEVELAEIDSTSINGSDEKYEPNYNENMFAKDNEYKIISDGEKGEEKVREEEFQELLRYSRPLDFFDRPEIPEDVFILRSDCPCYLEELRQTFDDKKGFRSEYSAYCSEEGNRIALESKMRNLAEELKDKMSEEPTTNFALKWAIEKKNISSWSGFDFDPLYSFKIYFLGSVFI